MKLKRDPNVKFEADSFISWQKLLHQSKDETNQLLFLSRAFKAFMAYALLQTTFAKMPEK
jgi:hypothetical protein